MGDGFLVGGVIELGDIRILGCVVDDLEFCLFVEDEGEGYLVVEEVVDVY